MRRQKYGCHHPFLLSSYPVNKRKDGCKFHLNFSKIGLSAEHAKHISFLELLDVPTIGNKSELEVTKQKSYLDARIIAKDRSLLRILGRFTDSRITINCCLRARFSMRSFLFRLGARNMIKTERIDTDSDVLSTLSGLDLAG